MQTNDDSFGPAPEESAEDQLPLAWECRVFAVAIVGIVPGVLCAAMLRLLLPRDYAEMTLIAGALLGALLGGLMEADHLI